jgi:hypothetical protein
MIQTNGNDSQTLLPCCVVSNGIDHGLNPNISVTDESEKLDLLGEDKTEQNSIKPDGSTNIQQTKWQAMYQQLLEFRSKYGHCLVPNRYRENQALGAWVSTQRRQVSSN